MWWPEGELGEGSLGRPYLSRQKVSREKTGGIVSKSCGGGGDAVRHSSVRPSHGSAGARAPARRLRQAFPMKRRMPSAIPKAPMVETRFQKPKPASAA